MPVLLIILVLIVGLVLYIISLYNKLVKHRQLTEEGWSGIDVQLKRRTDLIPNLLEAVKGYMAHEESVLSKVTEMRAAARDASNADPQARAEAEKMLSGALVQLFAVAENYPDLKASENFQKFQDQLAETEDQIQMARRYYNGAVRDLNILIESFPSNLVAGKFGFTKAEYFELENESERNVPEVSY